MEQLKGMLLHLLKIEREAKKNVAAVDALHGDAHNESRRCEKSYLKASNPFLIVHTSGGNANIDWGKLVNALRMISVKNNYKSNVCLRY